MPIRYFLYFILNLLLLASPVICNLFFSKTDAVSIAVDGGSESNEISVDENNELEELATMSCALSFIDEEIQHWFIFYTHIEKRLRISEIVPPPPRM